MSRLYWDEEGERLYETGVDRGVLYIKNNSGSKYGNGVAWNGLTGVTENPEGAEANDQYADNIKYISLISEENWKATIKAFTYPDEFNTCMGLAGAASLTKGTMLMGQQVRSKFGFSWRSLVGNDVVGDQFSYKIHLAYGLTVSPTEFDHATTNDSPEATEFSWDSSSIPVLPKDNTIWINGGKVAGVNDKKIKALSHIVILKKTGVNDTLITALENKLYGTVNTSAYLPTLDELIYFLKNHSWPA